ncbi:hypothetical protein FAZ15_04545 [Sphingobacterium olei]|uniref:Uncharacterized protein n=1 Tax=Sphingobacterium olei TaxID=2571155 RepID=A0A4U0P372_9SPHI|nr:hypothetical protein [Sphingobacterium olei]TJZ61791.1 hypothetical protein FAZ15_04545 [Sphingobacterium olei]
MIPVQGIESIEVLRTMPYKFAYGAQDEKSMIFVITTKEGGVSLNKAIIPKGILTITPTGLYADKTFYKPTYEASDNTNGIKDLRTMIHWEPSIVINKSGKTSFEFYTPDTTGTYRIIIEGIDINGRIGIKTVDFNVREK